MRLHSSTRGAVAAALLGCTLASAQSTDESTAQLPGFDLERMDTNMGKGTLLVGNGELMVQGGMSVSLLGHYQRMPLVLSDGVSELGVVRDRATAMLSASYGVLPWLELGAQVPFVLWQQGDDPSQVGLAQVAAQGIGTPVLQARLGLLSRRQQLQPVDLSADLGVGLPVGTGSALAGDAGPRVHARMVVGTIIGKLQPSLEAGVLFRPSVQLDTTESSARPGASSEVRVGASVATTGEGLRGELGLRTTFTPQVSMELMGGVRFPVPAGLEAFIHAGPGLGGALGTPLFRVLAGLSYRKEPQPPITYLERNADRALQIELAQHQLQRAENPVRPVSTVDLYATREDGPSLNRTLEETKRPYQPGTNERVVMRGEIHFPQGSSALQGVVPLLDQTVLRLSELPKDAVIHIEGHADDEGSDMTRSRLSIQRAQTVRRYLLDQNVPWTQVQARGLGSEWPVSTNPATDQERQLNRRVEVLVVIKTETSITTQAPVP